MLVPTAAWHGTLTVPGMAYPAPGITQQVHMQRGKLSTQGEVSTVQKSYHFEGLFFPFLCTFNENKLFFNLNKLPQLYSVHKHRHSQVTIFMPTPFDVLSCTLSRIEIPLSFYLTLHWISPSFDFFLSLQDIMNFRETKNMEMASHHAWRIQRLTKEINKYILEHTLQFPKSPPAAGLHLCQFESEYFNS